MTLRRLSWYNVLDMADMKSLYDEHADLSEADQKKAGKAIAGSMGHEHTEFVKLVCDMLTKKEIDPALPETLLNKDVFAQLSEEAKSAVELALVNIVDQLRHVAEFYLSKETPDASPQLQNMIEQLWHMKERVEMRYGDVFKI